VKGVDRFAANPRITQDKTLGTGRFSSLGLSILLSVARSIAALYERVLFYPLLMAVT
jgi:hypothetical protein